MYKLSKFNYTCLNNNGELLLYNSFVGTKSFCKIKRLELQKIYKTDFNFLDENLKLKLFKKGIIVPKDLDEDIALNNLIVQFMTPTDLSLTISPTERCNFRCKYCYESHNPITMSNTIQDNIIKYIRKNIFKFSNLNINWFVASHFYNLIVF